MKSCDLKYKRVHTGYIVYIEGREGHAHFKSSSGCQKLIRLLSMHKMPVDNYFKRAAKRVLTENEFAALLISQKPKYNNSSKKMKNKTSCVKRT